jgi:hypothetical protein
MAIEERPPARLITPKAAVKHAARIVAELRKNPLWQPALKGTEPQLPVTLVHQLHLPDSYYYVVPFIAGSRLGARVLIDGLSGGLVEIGAVDNDTRTLKRWITADEVVGVVLANSRALYPGSRVAAPAGLRREAITVRPVLAWKPCEQSTSRFLPFYATIAADRLVYVRVDGMFAAALTPGLKG